MNEREFMMILRKAFLEIVVAIEKRYGIQPSERYTRRKEAAAGE
jgi:hypothetical protein